MVSWLTLMYFESHVLPDCPCSSTTKRISRSDCALNRASTVDCHGRSTSTDDGVVYNSSRSFNMAQSLLTSMDCSRIESLRSSQRSPNIWCISSVGYHPPMLQLDMLMVNDSSFDDAPNSSSKSRD